MASRSCTACLRALQRQSKLAVRHRSSTPRTFTSSTARYVELPGPNATPATSIPVTPAPSEYSTPKSSIKKLTDKLTGSAYTAYGSTDQLYKECAAQAEYKIVRTQDDDAEVAKTADGEDLGVGDGWWNKELGLQPTFSTWSQVTMLHMYLLSVRFRCFPSSEFQTWQQHLLDHFFHDAENRMMINHGMHARGTRNKYLKDLFVQWRGLLAAYDEGLVKGDAVLAAAVWRNVWKANEDVDIKGLAHVVSHMRRVLKAIDGLSDEQIMMGEVAFSSPEGEKGVVGLKSVMINLPFEKAPGSDLTLDQK